MDTLIANIEAWIVGAIFTALMTYGGVFVRTFLKTKQSQDSLRKAIETAVDFVSDYLEKLAAEQLNQGGTVDQWENRIDTAVQSMVSAIYESVPDSLRFLKATEGYIAKMARGAVNVRLIALRERLNDQLSGI